MKKFAILLTVIFVTAGSAQARISSSRTFAHFPTCTDGLVKKMCVCRLSIWMVLPHIQRRLPTVTAIGDTLERRGAAHRGGYREAAGVGYPNRAI
jgi:hypothetical protein